MTENKKSKGKPSKKKSFIVGTLRKFKNAFYAQSADGFFGRKTESYEKANQELDNSFASHIFGKRSKLGKAIAKSRFFVADQFENSLSAYFLRKILRFLISCRIRLYGALFASFGVSVIVGYLIKRFIFSESGEDVWRIALSVALLLAAVPMIATTRKFSDAFCESELGRFISQNTLGISESKFEVSNVKHGNSYNFAVIAGIALGVLSLFVDPFIIFAVPLIIAAVAVVLYSPEAGVVITFIGLPFAALFGNDNILLWSIALFSISYIAKLARGKRIMRFDITDLFVMLFAFALVCGGINDNSGAANDFLVPLLVISGGFVVGNLMRTKLWQKRFVFSYVFAAAIIAAVTVIEFAFSESRYFANIFANYGFAATPDSAATFMLPALFVTLTFAIYSKKAKEKIASLLVAVLLAFAIAVTDYAVGYPLVIGLIILFIILKRETVYAVAVGLFAVPVTLTLLPWSVAKTLSRAFDLSSVLNYSSSKVFQGTIRMMMRFFVSGMGYGNYSLIYPYFAVSGFDEAERLPSTVLKLFENYGIIGFLLVFAVFALFFANCFGFMRATVNTKAKAAVAAGVSSVICLISKSVFFNTAGDIKLLFVMCSVFYITCAAVRNGRQEIEKNKIVYENSEFSASIEI